MGEMTRIRVLITRLGGALAVSRALAESQVDTANAGLRPPHVETIRSWQRRAEVPSRYIAVLVALGRARGLRLGLSDFFNIDDLEPPQAALDPVRWPPEIVVVNPMDVQARVGVSTERPGIVVVSITPPLEGR